MKQILAALVLLSTALISGNALAAQTTRTAIQTAITTDLASGSNITATELRTILTNVADSCYVFNTDTLSVAEGGTNLTSYTSGDFLYATGSTTLAKRTIGTTGQVLTVVGGVPTWTTSITQPIRVVTASGAITVALTDRTVVVNKTTGAASAVSLPASVLAGQTFIIKDGKADANTNNITITPNSGTIDGSATYVINTAKGVVRLQFDGTNYWSW